MKLPRALNILSKCEGQKATRGEDTLKKSYPKLMLHSDTEDIQLSGAWIGYVLAEGDDEYGKYLTVKLRPSRFELSELRAVDRNKVNNTQPEGD